MILRRKQNLLNIENFHLELFLEKNFLLFHGYLPPVHLFFVTFHHLQSQTRHIIIFIFCSRYQPSSEQHWNKKSHIHTHKKRKKKKKEVEPCLYLLNKACFGGLENRSLEGIAYLQASGSYIQKFYGF